MNSGKRVAQRQLPKQQKWSFLDNLNCRFQGHLGAEKPAALTRCAPKTQPGNANQRRKLSTVDLLVKVACFVKL